MQLRWLWGGASKEDSALRQKLKHVLGFSPSRLEIYRTACYHKSSLQAKPDTRSIEESNERLEYLGDAILSAVVAEYLFKKYPRSDEGFLTKMRSKVVKRKTLNHIADQLGVDELLMMVNDTKISPSMLGNALEAIIGALYIDKGYRRTRVYIIQDILQEYLNMNNLENFDDNYKSQLLEYCQKNGRALSYQVINQFKQQNRDRFIVEVRIDDEPVATGQGFNKKSAEQEASSYAIKQLHDDFV